MSHGWLGSCAPCIVMRGMTWLFDHALGISANLTGTGGEAIQNGVKSLPFLNAQVAQATASSLTNSSNWAPSVIF